MQKLAAEAMARKYTSIAQLSNPDMKYVARAVDEFGEKFKVFQVYRERVVAVI